MELCKSLRVCSQESRGRCLISTSTDFKPSMKIFFYIQTYVQTREEMTLIESLILMRNLGSMKLCKSLRVCSQESRGRCLISTSTDFKPSMKIFFYIQTYVQTREEMTLIESLILMRNLGSMKLCKSLRVCSQESQGRCLISTSTDFKPST